MNNVFKDRYPSPTAALEVSSFMSKVYGWMTLGIILTGFVAWTIGNDEQILYLMLSNKILFYGLIIAEFGLVIWISKRINQMGHMMAVSLFLLYAMLNGATLSLIAMAYTAASIQSAFFTSAIAFAGLSGFGYVTKRDLGPVGSFCTMGLFGLFGFSILSIFFPSMMGSMTSQIFGLVGIIVFAGLTAYDTQQIKGMARGNENMAIMGALKLYLDFINLFLFILRMSGDRRR